jgi:hypothetical protein
MLIGRINLKTGRSSARERMRNRRARYSRARSVHQENPDAMPNPRGS